MAAESALPLLTTVVCEHVIRDWPKDQAALHPQALAATAMAYAFRHSPELTEVEALRQLLQELQLRSSVPPPVAGCAAPQSSAQQWQAARFGAEVLERTETALKKYYSDWTSVEVSLSISSSSSLSLSRILSQV